MNTMDFFHFLFFVTIIVVAIFLIRLIIKADVAIAEKERNSMPIDTYENEIERLEKCGVERLKKRNKTILATALIISMILLTYIGNYNILSCLPCLQQTGYSKIIFLEPLIKMHWFYLNLPPM